MVGSYLSTKFGINSVDVWFRRQNEKTCFKDNGRTDGDGRPRHGISSAYAVKQS